MQRYNYNHMSQWFKEVCKYELLQLECVDIGLRVYVEVSVSNGHPVIIQICEGKYFIIH